MRRRKHTGRTVVSVLLLCGLFLPGGATARAQGAWRPSTGPAAIQDTPNGAVAAWGRNAGDGPEKEPVGNEPKEEKREEKEKEGAEKLSDLYLCNLCTSGWNEEYKERPLEGRAARIPLLRTRPGFLIREFRLDYRFLDRTESVKADDHQLLTEVLLPFNRRLLVGLEAEYAWVQPRDEPRCNGPAWAATSWLQLVDTADAALNLQLRVTAPAKDLGENSTRLGLVLAEFYDLGNRVGLQAHFGPSLLVGPGEPGGPHTQLDYAVALTKTLTEESARLKNLTVFVEAVGLTNLDGDRAGSTQISFLPGAWCEVGCKWSVAPGDQTLTVTDTTDDTINGHAAITVMDGPEPCPTLQTALTRPCGGMCELPPSGAWTEPRPKAKWERFVDYSQVAAPLQR